MKSDNISFVVAVREARMRFTAKLLFLVALLLVPAHAKRRKGQTATYTTNRKRDCETQECAGLHDDDRGNCVLKCQSPTCYDEVYAAEELEPGEIDMKRQRAFSACLTSEARKLQQSRRQNGRVTEVKSAGAKADDVDPEEPRAEASTDAVEL